MKSKNVTLYNLIFPIWLLWLIPTTWLVVIPGNLIVDALVVILTMKYLKIPDIKAKAKKVVWKTWLFGFLADFIGTVFMFLAGYGDEIFGRWWFDNVGYPVNYAPFRTPFSILYVAICIVITAAFIYLFNIKISFRKLNIEASQKKKLALSVAIWTAPYLFYLPTEWFFGMMY